MTDISQRISTFIRDNLGPTLAARNLTTKIIAPDTASWNNMDKYVTAIITEKGVATAPYSESLAALVRK